MSERVSIYPNLPTTADPDLRRALVDILRAHAIQINWGTGQDTSTFTGDGVVAHDLAPVNAAAGAVSCTLPKAKDWTDRTIRVKKTDSSANLVKILPQSGETIDGTATVAISQQWTCVQLMSTGSEWLIT